jgi:MFS family permease
VVGLLLSSSALFGLLYGLESFTAQRTQSTAPLWFALGGGAALAATFWHLRRTPHPLLDLSAYQWPTYRMINGNVALVFRASIAATPFLLPLLLQLVYGLSALQAGSYIMIYFLGNVAMKPATSPLLRRYGFRRVLVVNGVLSGLATAACGLVTPQGAWLLSAAVLFIAGLTRSMQFTCMNTLGFADLAPSQRSSGSTLHSMVLQVSTALGVAVAALLLQKSALLRHAASAGLPDFRLAFALVGLAGALAALCYLQLPRDAGARLIGETHG